MAEGKPKKDRPKLGMTCTSTKCEQDQHYFGPSQRKKKKPVAESLSEEREKYSTDVEDHHTPGCCAECGAVRVDWERLHKRNLADVAYTVDSLKFGCWQKHWWDKDIDNKAMQKARNFGQVELRQEAKQRLLKKVAPAKIFRDGIQTPFSDKAIFYAQHATATCCRKCMSCWHGISPGREMTEDEIEYCLDLIMTYIDARLPFLTKEGTVLCLPL